MTESIQIFALMAVPALASADHHGAYGDEG